MAGARERSGVRTVAVVAAVVIAAAAAGLLLHGLGRGPEAPGPRIAGADHRWHRTPVVLTLAPGSASPVRWRVDGGAWTTASRLVLPAPPDHSGDGLHAVEAAAPGHTARVTVRIDTTPPVLRHVDVRPRRLRGGQVHFAFDAPVQQGVRVSWRVADSLGRTVARTAPRPAGGPVSVAWSPRTAGGRLLAPGTYALVVRAADAAGNATTARVAFADLRPSPARVVSRLPQAGRLVALTFDGGSRWPTRHIIRTLRRLHAGASLFCDGQVVHKYPAMARGAVAAGITVGNHSFSHPDFRSLTPGQMRLQIQRCDALWWAMTDHSTAPFFRPPYGAYNEATVRAAGRAGFPFVVMWDVAPSDWAGTPPGAVARQVLSAVRPGSIVCLHTDWNAEEALPRIVRGLREHGLRPVSLDRLFRAAGLL